MNEINIVKVNANGSVKGVTYRTADSIDAADTLLHSYRTVYQIDALLNNPSHASRLGSSVTSYQWGSYHDFYDDPFQDTDRTYIYLDCKWYGYFVGNLVDLASAVDAVRNHQKSRAQHAVQTTLV